jgi:serine/threonine protein kinase
MSRSLHTELDEPLRAATRALTLARGQVLGGRYVVGEELGRGAVGKVFRAYDRATRTRVALKVVHPELVGRKSALLRFGREVRHARDVQHPNVCRVFELVASEGFTFFTMELAARGPLRIGPSRRRPMADCLADARAVAAGLAAIHRAGLVHRDLKPENLLRMADGRLVLSDFGLARPVAAQRKGRAGTAGYMAPEVRRGRPASARSDVWSLGVVLHQLFFGARDQDVEVPGPGLEAALSALCRSCMAGVAARRPPDGAAVLARLEELDGELLHDRLRRDRVPAEQALAIAVHVLEALAVLHRRGQAHGAVGPANVFLRRDGTTRLLRPESDAPLATPASQVEGDGTRADLTAAGHLLIECLGRRARSRRGAARLDVLLNRVPAAVRPILYRMLGPNRVQGPAEAGGLALELAAVADTLRDRRRVRRSPLGALIAEQRIASVLGVDLGAGAPDGKRQAAAIRTAESFGATCARLGEYRLIAVVEGGTPLDGASAAARCALALKAALPGARFAIATGRLNAGAGAPAGEAVERALGLLGAAGGDIALDGASAALLSVRFRIADSALQGESSLIDRPRTVLGKEIPCVGRDRELATLMGLWQECAAEPVARAVLVTAPAGAGKSRLLHELLDGIQ